MEEKDFRVGIIVEESQRYPFDNSYRGIITLTSKDVKDIFQYNWVEAYKLVKL